VRRLLREKDFRHRAQDFRVARSTATSVFLEISVSRNKQPCCKSRSPLVRPRALIQSNTRYKIYFDMHTVHIHYRFSRFAISHTPIKSTIIAQISYISTTNRCKLFILSNIYTYICLKLCVLIISIYIILFIILFIIFKVFLIFILYNF